MQADKEAAAAAGSAAAKPPSICDRVQRAFHARPAFRPLRRLTVRHQDGGASSKPADAGAAPGPASKLSGPPVPAPPQPLTPSPAPAVGGAPAAKAPAPVRLPAVAEKKAVASAPSGPPVPVPPPGVTAGMATPADAKAEQTKANTRVGSRLRKALSSN